MRLFQRRAPPRNRKGSPHETGKPFLSAGSGDEKPALLPLTPQLVAWMPWTGRYQERRNRPYAYQESSQSFDAVDRQVSGKFLSLGLSKTRSCFDAVDRQVSGKPRPRGRCGAKTYPGRWTNRCGDVTARCQVKNTRRAGKCQGCTQQFSRPLDEPHR